MSTEFHKDFPVEEDDEEQEEEEDEEAPTKEDCCNSGCTPCVFDIYQKRMEEKKKKRREKGEDLCRQDLISQITFKPFIVLEKSDFGDCYCRLTFQPVVRKSDLVQVKQKYFENIKFKGLGERDSVVEIGRNESKNIDLEENKRTVSIVGIEQRDSKNIHLDGSRETDLIVEIEQNDSKNVSSRETDLIVEIEQNDSKNVSSRETDLIVEIEQNDSKNVSSRETDLIVEIVEHDSENLILGENKRTDSTGEMGRRYSRTINLEENLGTKSLVGIEQSDSKNIELQGNLGTDLEVEIQQKDSENVTTEDEKVRHFNKMVVDVNVDLEIMSKGKTNLKIDVDDPKDSKDMNSKREDNCTNNHLLGEENAKIVKEKQIDDLLGEENFDIVKEQKIDGYLPYKPGQHLTMKSWRMDNSEDEQNIENFPQNTREASMGTKPQNYRIRNQNSDEYLMSEEEFIGSDNENFPQNTREASMGTKTVTNINRNPNSDKYLMSEEEFIGSDNENFPQNTREASMETKTATHINRNQNSDKYLMSEEEFVGSEKSDSITRTVVTNFVNKNEDFTSKEEIMESEEYKLNATTETPDLISQNKNLPPYSISKEKIMGTKKPNFITRDYTPITLAESSSNCSFQIIIKYYENGEMSKYLKSLKLGDITYFRGPYGDFQYLKNHDHILAICMGTGIAPIYPIFKSILNDETDETFLKLLYGSKDPQSIILRDELRDMAKFWNFGAEMFLTEGKVEGAKFGENFRAGRIGAKCVYENLKPKQLVLVCGSEIFTQEIVGYLSEFDRWRVEYFVF